MSGDPRIATDEERLQAAIQKIVDSPSAKKLVVAGPGTGKTTLFGALLDGAGGGTNDNLILTFINALKDDLESSFGDAPLCGPCTATASVCSTNKPN